MHTGSGILVIAVLLLAYGAFSGRLSRYLVSAPMVFTAAGVLVGPAVFGFFAPAMAGSTTKYLIEAALALMLFNDAARIDLRALRAGAVIPERLVGIALPLIILLGALLAWGLFRELAFAEIMLVALILAPTDATLGQAVVTNESIPVGIRQGLNVESGLNDGLVVPLFLVALDAAQAVGGGRLLERMMVLALEQIGWGLLAGVVAGIIGGLIVRMLDERRFIEGAWRQIIAVGTVGASFGLAGILEGSVFLAAFAGGAVFGRIAKQRGSGLLHLNEQTSAVLTAATFIAFGALALGPYLGEVTWRIALYGILSLTLVRMLPVAVAMLRSRARPATVAFLGWFGPRGLASIVFGLVVFGEAVPNSKTILLTVTFTVTLSIFLHGATAKPLSRAYASWYERHMREGHAMMEGRAVQELPVRFEEGFDQDAAGDAGSGQGR